MATRKSAIVGVFNDRVDAERAVDMLGNAGIPHDQISTSGGGEGGGFLAGLKHLFGGQETTPESVRDDLVNMGLSNDEAAHYAREHQAGRTIVAVNARGHEQEAMTILRNSGGTMYGTPSSSSATTTTSTTASTMGTSTTRPPLTGQDATVQRSAAGMRNDVAGTMGTTGNVTNVNDERTRNIKLREEQLHAEKELVQTGEVRLHKEVVTEQRQIDVPVTHEEVIIERRAVTGGAVDNTPIGQDEVIRVPVSEEQVQVNKQTVVTGEVSIGKRAVQENQEFTDTVKREEVRVEKQGDPDIVTDPNTSRQQPRTSPPPQNRKRDK